MRFWKGLLLVMLLGMAGCGGSGSSSAEEDMNQIEALEAQVKATINTGSIRDPNDLADTVFMTPSEVPGRYNGTVTTRGGREANFAMSLDPNTKRPIIVWEPNLQPGP
jgi:hypothetical protein